MRRLLVVLAAVALPMALMGPVAAMDVAGTTFLFPDEDLRFIPTVSIDGQNQELADIDSITPPANSPNGSQVAFSGAIGDESLGRYAVFVVNRDGTGLDQVTTGSLGEFDPAWSPDGSTLVVVQNTAGSLSTSSCCRLGLVDLATEVLTPLTTTVGTARPTFTHDGNLVVYDTPSGIWTVPASGGATSQIATAGFDASVSPDDTTVAFLHDDGATREVRSVSITGGGVSTVYSTTDQLENPVWLGGRIYVTQYEGLGYDGRSNVQLLSMDAGGGDVTVVRTFADPVVGVTPGTGNDELFFYRSDGTFQYYDIDSQANLGSPILEGTGYSSGWSSITSVDLDGDGTDEILFYRSSTGTFKYYEMHPSGALGNLINGSDGYSTGWSSISAIDLDGDGQDEMFFYRATDGVFKYYEINSSGTLGALIKSGSGYSTGWSSITAVDLDGDWRDELFFYREDGSFRYYNIDSNANLGSPIQGGTGYSTGWSSITAIDLEGDGQDEMFFYRDDGTFRYYNINSQASLGAPIASGSNYTTGWSVITAIDLDG